MLFRASFLDHFLHDFGPKKLPKRAPHGAQAAPETRPKRHQNRDTKMGRKGFQNGPHNGTQNGPWTTPDAPPRPYEAQPWSAWWPEPLHGAGLELPGGLFWCPRAKLVPFWCSRARSGVQNRLKFKKGTKSQGTGTEKTCKRANTVEQNPWGGARLGIERARAAGTFGRRGSAAHAPRLELSVVPGASGGGQAELARTRAMHAASAPQGDIFCPHPPPLKLHNYRTQKTKKTNELSRKTQVAWSTAHGARSEKQAWKTENEERRGLGGMREASG